MNNTFAFKRKVVARFTRLELKRVTAAKNAKNNVIKKKPVNFTFTQVITGAFCILHVTILVTRLL